MIEFGKTLREAREAKGMSVADIAAKTHMMSAMVADLEREDFSRLPAPIYGRGFIKLYCETVGIDPAPLVAEFMEICNGNREPAIRERMVAPSVPDEATQPVETAETAAATTIEATETSAPADFSEPAATDGFGLDSAPSEEPAPVELDFVSAPEPPRNEQLDLFSARVATTPPEPVKPSRPAPKVSDDEPPKREHMFTHYASPLRERAIEFPRLAPAIGRWCVVIGVLALLAWGVTVGLRALYRATSNTTTSEPAAPAPAAKVTPTETVAPAKPAPAAKAKPAAATKPVKTNRKPIAVPPLYID